jgi:hypothetical protein
LAGTDWLFTLAQASATFVAIVAAFFTAKILSIASEKQTLKNRTSVIDAELANRRALHSSYKEKIDSIRRQWAEESVSRFADRLKLFWKIGKLDHAPSMEEILWVFNKEEKREPDADEMQVLQTRYASLKSEIEEAMEKNRREREQPSLFAMPRFPEVRLPLSPEIALESARAERANFIDLKSKYEHESNSITILEGTKKTYQDQIKALAFPPYAIFGFLSLAYFAIVGVVVPLAYAAYISVIDETQAGLFLSFFISGLFLTFAYIYAEIMAALGRHADLPIVDASSTRTLRAEKWLHRFEGGCKIIVLVCLLLAAYESTQIMVPISSQSTTIVEPITSTVTFSTNLVQQTSSCTTLANGTQHCANYVNITQPIVFTDFITGYQSRIVPTQRRAVAEYWLGVFEIIALIFFLISLSLSGIRWRRSRGRRLTTAEVISK